MYIEYNNEDEVDSNPEGRQAGQSENSNNKSTSDTVKTEEGIIITFMIRIII